MIVFSAFLIHFIADGINCSWIIKGARESNEHNSVKKPIGTSLMSHLMLSLADRVTFHLSHVDTVQLWSQGETNCTEWSLTINDGETSDGPVLSKVCSHVIPPAVTSRVSD